MYDGIRNKLLRFGLLTCLGVYSIARVPCASPFFRKIRGRVHNLLLLPRTPRTLDSPLLGNGCVCRIGADKSRRFKTCIIAWCVLSSGSATKRRKLAKTEDATFPAFINQCSVSHPVRSNKYKHFATSFASWKYLFCERTLGYPCRIDCCFNFL